MSREKIEKLIATIDSIPPLPEISSAVTEALNDEEVAIVEVSELIEKDVALASQILKVANSPAYGALNTISNIQHAIMMLGLDEVRSLLLAFAVEQFFATDAEKTELRKRFWQHSRVCSFSALMLAHHYQQQDSSSYFLAGLIHDIGKLIVDQFLPEEHDRVIALIREQRCSYRDAEKEVLGTRHAQIGGILLQHWNFPESITNQVFRHHMPWKEKEEPGPAIILFLANLLTKMAGHTCVPEEKVVTAEQFGQSKAINYVNSQGFALDEAQLGNFLAQINEFVSADQHS